ncbi:hypothetical protein ABE10_02205, partial [Bacillus toyonensis]|nr:hypothetical protein [Bacillus toyonensis]
VHTVELDGTRRLALMMLDESHRDGVALDERAGGDHLADVEPRAVLAAQAPERGVGDPRHRGEHHRRIEPDRTDAQRTYGGGGESHPLHSPRSGAAADRRT